MSSLHCDAGHVATDGFRKRNSLHLSQRAIALAKPCETVHAVKSADCLETLTPLPDNSIDLIICDPPYNIKIASWDSLPDFVAWAKEWLRECERVLTDSGNLAIFGGLQYQKRADSGDFLDILTYMRRHSCMRLVNLIVWHYRNGRIARRFFANRHEEIAWFAKTERYYFNLDAVRVPFDKASKEKYIRDKRLKSESIEKGKNPTNVWQIPRLNANSCERVGHRTQKPLELIRRLTRALSYPGSTVLDFFAGSASTTRVAIEEGRHSIANDIWPELMIYLAKQTEVLWRTNSRLFSANAKFRLLPESEFLLHPAFHGRPSTRRTAAK